MPEVRPEEYQLRYFKEHGYERRKCRVGGDYFWTINASFDTCQDVPDVDYWFDKIPSVRGLTVRDVRRKFIDFFAKRGHQPVKPRPVVARWREDLYLTIASIVVFQPHVTNGIVPPPANPLVISQPCIRLEDIDNVGLTIGRHLTTFEMAAHHAFNYPDKYVYWKDETVEYAYEFFTKEIGIPGDMLVFKESWWEGGGNAGPSFEVTAGGLELATLVFMQYKVEDGKYVDMPLKIVDTGYGVERIAWFSQKTPTAFMAIYGDLVDWFRSKVGVPKPSDELLWAAFRAAGRLNPDDEASVREFYRRVAAAVGYEEADVRRVLEDEARLYSLLDHTKTIAMMLGDGVVPSNSGEGYLARLVIRRALRQLRSLGSDASLADLVERQIEYWGDDFPQLRENRGYILDAVSVEEGRYRDLLARGVKIVERELSGRTVGVEDLVRLYDSYGIPPEIVAEVASKRGITIAVPRNFYSLVAARHRSPPKVRELGSGVSLPQDVVSWALSFPATRLLFHEDPYMKEFKARLLGYRGEYVILDSTAFYATGGGQLHDTGQLELCGDTYNVIDVQKVGPVVVHRVDRPLKLREGCSEVVGRIDWPRRFRLMRHHTATHIVLAAARKVLGPHVWQAGAEKTPEKARLDITHHRPLTKEEVKKIEELANRIVDERLPVLRTFMDRNSAEEKYGFVLYEGGVPMESTIRVVEIPGWDAEACFGTHVTNTGEVGGIKIVNVERIQDGVVRLEFVAGTRVPEEMSKLEDEMERVDEELDARRGEELAAIRGLKEGSKAMEEALKVYRSAWLQQVESSLRASEPVAGVKLLVAEFPEKDVRAARETLKRLTDDVPESLVLLAVRSDKNVVYEIGIGAKASEIVKAEDLVSYLRERLGGSGGGRGTHGTLSTAAGAEEVLSAVKEFLQKLKK